jgi:hypothetical protein
MEREGWTIPIVVDDQNNSVSRAFGLTFFPFTVFVDADGVVLGRLSGAIGVEEILNIADQAFQ